MAGMAHTDAWMQAWSSLKAYAGACDLNWHICGRVDFVCHHPNGRRWVVCPDLMVHTQGGNAPRPGYMWYSEDGPPDLILEVLDHTSWRYETDMVAGKGMRYMAMGVQEYLVFDPYAKYLGEHIRGWRSVEGQPHPWQPDGRGRYWSRTLGVCFLPLPDWHDHHIKPGISLPLVPGVLDQSGNWIGVPRDYWPASLRKDVE